jgi:hypothetical protein
MPSDYRLLITAITPWLAIIIVISDYIAISKCQQWTRPPLLQSQRLFHTKLQDLCRKICGKTRKALSVGNAKGLCPGFSPMPYDWRLYSTLQVTWLSRGSKYASMYNDFHRFHSTERVFKTKGRSPQGEIPWLSAPFIDSQQDTAIFLQTLFASTFTSWTNCQIFMHNWLDEKRWADRREHYWMQRWRCSVWSVSSTLWRFCRKDCSRTEVPFSGDGLWLLPATKTG